MPLLRYFRANHTKPTTRATKITTPNATNFILIQEKKVERERREREGEGERGRGGRERGRGGRERGEGERGRERVGEGGE
jgi:hypothetical protein